MAGEIGTGPGCCQRDAKGLRMVFFDLTSAGASCARMNARTPPLPDRIRACRHCADRFAATATAHRPRPVAWFAPGARVLVAAQAPGIRVHRSGRPFDDASGRRLRDWMGVDEATFWDTSRVAVVPMGFCFPGYDAKGADLPPPRDCARLWRAEAMDYVGDVPVTLLIGG